MHQFGCNLRVSITLPFRIVVFEDEFWASMYPSSRSASRSFSVRGESAVCSAAERYPILQTLVCCCASCQCKQCMVQRLLVKFGGAKKCLFWTNPQKKI